MTGVCILSRLRKRLGDNTPGRVHRFLGLWRANDEYFVNETFLLVMVLEVLSNLDLSLLIVHLHSDFNLRCLDALKRRVTIASPLFLTAEWQPG